MQPFLPGDRTSSSPARKPGAYPADGGQCIKNGLYLPYEDTGIPKEIAGAQEGDRQFEVGFFREGLHLKMPVLFAVGELDITITGIGLSGEYPG